LEGVAMEDVGVCRYFMAIWYILWPFGILYGLEVNSPITHLPCRRADNPIYPTANAIIGCTA
jgi:hypothetical protein